MNKTFMLQAATMACLGHLASAAIVEDGIWTGNDWYDSANDIGVSNGVPYSNNAKV